MESIAWLSRVPDEKPWNFPSGHAMSSSRLFLGGLLSSRARLRLAGRIILSTQNIWRYR
jgi:membrane-associated phospholipid phosphatase